METRELRTRTESVLSIIDDLKNGIEPLEGSSDAVRYLNDAWLYVRWAQKFLDEKLEAEEKLKEVPQEAFKELDQFAKEHSVVCWLALNGAPKELQNAHEQSNRLVTAEWLAGLVRQTWEGVFKRKTLADTLQERVFKKYSEVDWYSELKSRITRKPTYQELVEWMQSSHSVPHPDAYISTESWSGDSKEWVKRCIGNALVRQLVTELRNVDMPALEQTTKKIPKQRKRKEETC